MWHKICSNRWAVFIKFYRSSFFFNFWTNRNKYKGFSASLPLDGTVQRTKTIVASVWTKFWLFRAKTMICLRYSKYFYLLCDTLYFHFCQMAKKFNKEYTLFHSRPIGKCTWIMKMSSKLTLFEVDWFSVARNEKVIRVRPLIGASHQYHCVCVWTAEITWCPALGGAFCLKWKFSLILVE